MSLRQQLASNGIIVKVKDGITSVDCPKPYCKTARVASDSTPLMVEIVGNCAKWNCSNCAWKGSIEPDEKILVQLKPERNPISDPTLPIVIALASEADILRECGVKNVINYAETIFTEHAYYFLRNYRIFIAFDAHTAGEKLRHECIRRIGAAKCWDVKFYAGSARETFEKHGADFICQDINEATPHPIRGLYEVDDFMNEVMQYYDGGMAAGVSTGWPNVDKLFTVLPGQFTVITGIPNSGKSTWLDALCCNIANHSGWRFAVFSPENPKALHTIYLAQKKIRQPINPKHPHRMSREALVSGAAWVREHFKFIVSSSLEDPPTLEWILARGADAVLRYGVKAIIIDPWNRIVKKYDNGQNESAYVETALAHILRFALNHDVHVFLVAHPTKQEPNKKTGKFDVPSLYSISGGANFPNMMDNGIVIYRPIGADSEHVTEVWSRKIRFDHVGQVGHTNLKFDKDTGCFEMLDEPAATYLFGNADPDMDTGIQVLEATL